MTSNIVTAIDHAVSRQRTNLALINLALIELMQKFNGF